jgi:hypothetical protein
MAHSTSHLRRWLVGGAVVTAAFAAFAAVTPAGASQPVEDPPGTQPEPGSIDLTPFDPTVTLETQPPNPNPQPVSTVEAAQFIESAVDLGVPDLAPTPDLGDPNRDGSDEPTVVEG